MRLSARCRVFVVPVRVIESVQTDGAVVYELFAPGLLAQPTLEVRGQNGEAGLLPG